MYINQSHSYIDKRKSNIPAHTNSCACVKRKCKYALAPHCRVLNTHHTRALCVAKIFVINKKNAMTELRAIAH